MNDYGTLTAPETLTLERVLPGPIERVWRYLSDSELRGQWLASGVMEPRVGGAIELQFFNSGLTKNDDPPPAKHAGNDRSGFTGRITACEPPHRLAFIWGDGSEVEFTLRTERDRVHLRIVHARLATRDARISVAGGWHTHVGILVALLEDREPEGFWRTYTRLEHEYAQKL